ncbi:MAG: hypothetical protein ABII00_15660, partial [Elusimicrobiota bacterium]
GAAPMGGAGGGGGGGAMDFFGAGAGGGGAGGGAGGNFVPQGAQAPAAGATYTKKAKRKEIEAQQQKHFEAAETYHSGAVEPLLSREKAGTLQFQTDVNSAADTLSSLDDAVVAGSKSFADLPAAHSVLMDTHHLISDPSSGSDMGGLEPRLRTASQDISSAGTNLERFPTACEFNPTVTRPVGPRYQKCTGQRRVCDGYDKGYGGCRTERTGCTWVQDTETVQLDLRKSIVMGQDLMAGAVRRSVNVRREAHAGIPLVDDSFGPIVADLRAARQYGRANQLEGLSDRIRRDLTKVTDLIAEDPPIGSVSGQQSPHDKIRAAADSGHRKFRDLNEEVSAKHLTYPEHASRRYLLVHAGDALLHSRNALTYVNGMRGQPQDTLMTLINSMETSTKAYIEICDSSDNLKDLAARAPQ